LEAFDKEHLESERFINSLKGKIMKQEAELIWEELPSKSSKGFEFHTFRARIIGGWLVITYCDGNATSTFVPDPEHAWDGSPQ
jgi:hypothetical protein